MKNLVPKIIVAVVLIYTVFIGSLQAQEAVYANSVSSYTSGLCIGCGVADPNNSVASDTTNYSVLNVTAGVLGAKLNTTYNFNGAAKTDRQITMIIGNDNGQLLDVNLLSNIVINTYNGNNSNNENLQVTSDFINIVTLSDGRYALTITPNSKFNRVRITMNAGIIGASNQLRVYGVKHHEPSVLPIELGEFDVNSTSNGNALVEWITYSEKNNAYFTIEVSYDNENFKEVDYILGAGNSNEVISYEKQIVVENTTTYVRLKQTDFDGKFTYSDSEILMPVEENDENNTANVYSFGNTIKVTSNNNAPLFTVYDITGKVINQKVIIGTETLIIDGMNGANVVFYTLENGSNSSSGKLYITN